MNADSNPVRGAKACGTFEQGPEFAASFPSRASLHQRYIGNWINNRIRVVPPGSSTPGPDLTDRVKFRATAETEWLWSDCVCPRFLGLKIGPVRAIRLVQGAASGYMTTRTDYFYPTHAGTVIRLRVHPGVSNIEHFTDYVSSVSGAKLYTKTGGTATAQAIIDGSPGNDPGNAAWLDWTQANTAGGRLVWFFREPRPINAGVPEYTLLDSSTVTKDPEFQPGAYGNHGEKWPGPTSNLEDPACFMNPDHPNLLYAESHALVFAFPAGGSESAQEAADLQAQFENLLSHTVVAEDRNFPPPSPPPPSCPVFVNETNPNNGRYLDAAPTTGPPSTPCSDSTAAFSVERAIGSGDFVKVGEIPKNGTFRDFEIYRGATYRYRVRGRNALGVEGPVSPIVTMTANDAEPPSVPVGVAMVGTEQSVTLSWDPSPSRDIRGFHVYLSTLPGGPYTRANATLIAASKLSFKASVPANGITYYGVIRAEDWASNLSPESEEVSAIPIP